MTRRVVSTVVLVCVGVAAALAQGKPNFSGTWELDLDRTRAETKARAAAASAGVPSGGGVNLMTPSGPPPVTAVNISQTVTTVTVDRVSGQVAEKLVLKLDGTESVTETTRMTLKLKSRWDGAKLVSEGASETRLADGSGAVSGTLKEVRWIEQDGYMVVESTRVVAPQAGAKPFAARPTVQYFKRK